MQLHRVDSVEAAARAPRHVKMLQNLGANASGQNWDCWKLTNLETEGLGRTRRGRWKGLCSCV